MIRRIVILILAGCFLINIYGCVAVVAGAAGGVGTATWLSVKLSKDVNASYNDTIKATEAALKSMRLKVAKKTVEEKVAQIMSKYTDGKTIWIDIRPITDSSSKIDVRVGGVVSDREAADKILKRIERYL